MKPFALANDPLLKVLRDIQCAASLDEAGWDPVIRLARVGNVLARLAEDLDQAGLLDGVPDAPRAHLLAARLLGQRQRLAGMTEIERVRQALATSSLRTVLLKGAAYLAAGLPLSRGRLFGDIDLLFHREDLPEAESALALHGWTSGAVTEYDQRYYREWMHELPPLTHMRRESVLDVHHNILPSTARHPPDPRLLLDRAIEVAHLPGIYVLCPADMLLHSACHLFHEGELDNGLRDLSDLDKLLRHFGAREGFWDELEERAGMLHLELPLQYALSLCTMLLGTPLPAAMQRVAARMPGWRRHLMGALYSRALRANHPLCADRATPLARWLLYVRAHWLRMPPHLLGMHLARKAWLRAAGLSDQPPAPPVAQP